jgi:hypothetical protein
MFDVTNIINKPITCGKNINFASAAGYLTPSQSVQMQIAVEPVDAVALVHMFTGYQNSSCTSETLVRWAAFDREQGVCWKLGD